MSCSQRWSASPMRRPRVVTGDKDLLDHADLSPPAIRAREASTGSRIAARMRKAEDMAEQSRFTAERALAIGETIGIDWSTSRFDVEQFRMGLDVELEHGRHDPKTNVTDDDEQTTGKIAWAHLNEIPDYYTRLGAMETEAERYWSERRETE